MESLDWLQLQPQSWSADRCRTSVLGWVTNEHASGRHCASIDPDWLRLSCSRPALLVSLSCHRRCHWHWLLRRRMDSVATLTCRPVPADTPAPVLSHSSKRRCPRPSCRGARRICMRPRFPAERSGTGRRPNPPTKTRLEDSPIPVAPVPASSEVYPVEWRA